jgi:hypothetical protein
MTKDRILLERSKRGRHSHIRQDKILETDIILETNHESRGRFQPISDCK